jgi:8-oxo-dGTP pyrophosphatase MutT (NUDIX family)
MNPTNLIDFLKKRLMIELPGFESHKKMFPTQKGIPFRTVKATKDAKKSAVLLLIAIEDRTNRISILFTLRSNKLKKHSGQISFPGGKCDENESFEETALRETYEEVGIPKKNIEVLGELSEIFVPPSNNIIKPIVGTCSGIPKLIINPDEVEEAFFIELGDLLLPEKIKVKESNFANFGKADVPYFDIHQEVPLWGATAIILSEFLDLINESK